MLSWMKQHAHVLIAAAGGVGVVLTAVAANTTGLLPNSVGAWVAATGAIIVQVVAVLAGGKVATQEQLRLRLEK